MISKEVTLEVEGLNITGQLYMPPEAVRVPYPTVCVCHGIPQSISDANSSVSDGGYPRLAEKICGAGFAVLIFNFRGTGSSGGNFDILEWTRDLEAAIDYLWLLPEVKRSHLSLLGFSGGAAVAVYVAAQDKSISSVAVCACPAEFSMSLTEVDTPESVVDYFRGVGIIRDETFPSSYEDWLNSFKTVNPIKHIAEVSPRPLLLLHGGQDEVVTVSHAYRLYAQAGEPKHLIIVNGGGHRLRLDERAMAIVIDWLKSQSRIGA